MLGRARVRELEASDCIFTERVVRDAHAGRLRALSSLAPARHAAPLPLPARRRARGDPPLPDHPPRAPSFTSEDPAHPGYGQLGRTLPGGDRRRGVDDGSEMGAFSLPARAPADGEPARGLDDYLRFGLEAALIPET